MQCTNLIDLSSIALDEADSSSWLQAMPLGTYNHPQHGTISFTPETLSEYAAGVNNRVRTADIPIDYDHAKYHGEASGWVRQAEVRNDGLWLLVEWTKTAAQKIKEKAYKYFSPTFIDKWTHPKTNVEYKNVLLGGAITNTPFIRDIATLNLTEEQTEELMSKELAKRLGLPEDADEATILAKIDELQTPATNDASSTEPPKPLNGPKPATTTPPAPVGSSTQVPVAASEFKAMDDPVVRAMHEELQVLKLANMSMLVERQVAKLSESGRKYAIPPVLLSEVQTVMLEAGGNTELSEKVFKLFDKITKDGLVQLGEIGHQTQDNNTLSAVKRLSDAKDALMLADNTLTVADAYERAAADNPSLWSEYLDETTVQGGVH